jgi:hypothetical protein
MNLTPSPFLGDAEGHCFYEPPEPRIIKNHPPSFVISPHWGEYIFEGFCILNAMQEEPK